MPLAVDIQEADENSTLHHYRRFLKWRKNSDLLRLGDIELLESPSAFFAFRRTHNGQSMFCVFNTVNDKEELYLPEDGVNRTLVTDHSRGATLENNKLVFNRYGYAFLTEA